MSDSSVQGHAQEKELQHGESHASSGHSNAGEKNTKAWIFVGIVFVAIIVLFALLQNMSNIMLNFFWILIILVILFIFYKFKGVVELRDYQRAVVFRFGKVSRVSGPGLAIILPLIEKYVLVDLRTQAIDVKPQEVITKDEIDLRVDAVIYLRVKKDRDSVIKSVVAVENYKAASVLFVLSLIRDAIGGLTLSEVILSVEQMNEHLKVGLEKISADWGIEVQSVKLQDVRIPPVVLDAMHEERAAEQRKLARFESALAHKKEIEVVKEATENLSDRALAYYYIKALEKLGEGSSSKIIFPMEFSKIALAITQKLGGFDNQSNAGLDEIFKKYEPAIKKFLQEQEEKKPLKKK